MKTQTYEMQHTAGPWTVATYGEPVKWLSIKRGAETIAKIEAVETPLDDEGKANARLIAAAPILYDFVVNQAAIGNSDAANLLASSGFAVQ